MTCHHCDKVLDKKKDKAKLCPLNGQPGHETCPVCEDCYRQMTATVPA